MTSTNIICKICGEEIRISTWHIVNKHSLTHKEYYDIYLKSPTDSICIICGAKTKFLTLVLGYRKCCSSKCALHYRNKKLYEIYGVSNIFQLEEIKLKIKITNLLKYGVENPSQSSIVKEKKRLAAQNKYGTDSVFQSLEVQQKIKDTNIKQFGVENVFQSLKMQQQIRNIKKEKYGDATYTNRAKAELTMLERYGSSQPMEIPEFLDKSRTNGGSLCSSCKYQTKFGNIILVQGKLETKFVSWCELNDIKVENGPVIKYFFKNKLRTYHSDFTVTIKDNIKIVEIKSSYWYKRLKEEVEAKKEAAEKYAREHNSEYILLIDKTEL